MRYVGIAHAPLQSPADGLTDAQRAQGACETHGQYTLTVRAAIAQAHHQHMRASSHARSFSWGGVKTELDMLQAQVSYERQSSDQPGGTAYALSPMEPTSPSASLTSDATSARPRIQRTNILREMVGDRLTPQAARQLRRQPAAAPPPDARSQYASTSQAYDTSAPVMTPVFARSPHPSTELVVETMDMYGTGMEIGQHMQQSEPSTHHAAAAEALTEDQHNDALLLAAMDAEHGCYVAPPAAAFELDDSYASEELQAQLLRRRQATLPLSAASAPLDPAFYSTLPPEQQRCLSQQLHQQEQLERMYTELQQKEAETYRQQQQQQRLRQLQEHEALLRLEHERRLHHFRAQQQQNEEVFRRMEEQRMYDERQCMLQVGLDRITATAHTTQAAQQQPPQDPFGRSPVGDASLAEQLCALVLMLVDFSVEQQAMEAMFFEAPLESWDAPLSPHDFGL